MAIDFTVALTDSDGTVLPDTLKMNGATPPPGWPAGVPFQIDLTLGRACTHALLMPTQERGSEEASFRRADLALRISDGEANELSADEIVMIREAVARTYGAIVVHRVVSLLDPATARKWTSRKGVTQ